MNDAMRRRDLVPLSDEKEYDDQDRATELTLRWCKVRGYVWYVILRIDRGGEWRWSIAAPHGPEANGLGREALFAKLEDWVNMKTAAYNY